MQTIKAAPPISGSPRAPAVNADRLTLLLIASVPVLAALTTWDPAETGAMLTAVPRHFSLAAIAVELLVILRAMATGFKLSRAIGESPPWMRACLATLVAVAFITAAWVAVDFVNAMVRTCTLAVHLIFGLGSMHLMRRWRPGLRELIWPAIIAGACAYMLLFPIYISAIPDPAAFDWRHFGLAVTNIRQIGPLATVGACAALGLAICEARRPRFALWVAAASLFFALSFWSGTRGSLAAIVAAFLFGLALLPALRSARAVVALVAAAMIGGALSLLHSPPDGHYGMARMSQSLARSGADAVSSGRSAIWTGTLRTIGERPLFGYGESQFRLMVAQGGGNFNHPHNVILQIALNWGIVGAFCFFLLAAAIWWKCFVRSRLDPVRLASAFLMVNALLIYSLWDGAFYYPYPIMMIALGVAYMLTNEGAAGTRRA